MAKKGGGIIFLIFLIFGLYFINLSLNLVPAINTILSGINQWIVLIGGLLIILGGFNQMRLSRYSQH